MAALYTRTPSLTASDDTNTSSDSDRASLPVDARDRPLPRIPAKEHSKAVLDNRRSSHTLSSLFPPSLPSGLIDTLRHPRVLACFLTHCSWSDFHALACTSRQVRWTVFRQPDAKEVIFAQYIPGYRYCLRNSDLDRYRDIKITLSDLNFFIMSQSIPLHQYPMHALSVLSALLPTSEQEDLTRKYMAATLAHSRSVLVLQSLIHSAVVPHSPDSEDSRPSLSPTRSGVRELVFPAPLSYFGGKSSLESRSASRGARSTSRSSGRTSRSVGSLLNFTRTTDSRSPSLTQGHGRERSLAKNRLSFFGGNPRTPLPPPAEEPAALRFYSGGWRRAFRGTGYASEDEGEPPLPRPHRRFASVGATRAISSSQSSLSSPSQHSPTSSPRLLERDSSERSSFILGANGAFGGPRSPHDITLATSRSRAPILRVFVPCSRLSEASIRACEDQLVDAGLWDHLSTGDIVCNLGYVPEQGQEPDREADWLIFNGYSLVIFRPPHPPPIENPLTLPSPLYYAHILPLFVNPTYSLSLPAPAYAPHMTLAYMSTSVPSVRWPTGRAAVKKYMWLAVLKAQVRPGLGEGWQGEWVLEGEGTREGKQSLWDAIVGDKSGEREWEVVRERCHGGRLWLKLLTPVDAHPHPNAAHGVVHTPRTQTTL